ncbi:UDP-N-acetylmuramate dehydrogenase [Alkalihalobacillus trypoxylicola]|uniref:UDP-N-acetylenolpyruvoylglucosamine reductase n=1 Tax=Alkalihalobacillus trypoxylicola TaxID=519424 RepID=A0A162DPL9_9BACI|nr:UDP-N-acetylmuramate dehydrogenase [Alkalihalobacillus trypoxylicola]KYG30487.1 UDP-N-acetylenolpyruvoylglucosamine reductase [Alkalihalobacillus trypoxylicola]
MNNTVYKDLLSILKNDENIKINQSLSYYTYTKTGGPADVIVFPTSIEQVQQIYMYTLENQLPLTILGNASNLIIKDGGIRGVVMILTEMKQVNRDGYVIKAQSGAAIINVSRFALEHSLTGLEFACGIPGSIGGALYMNAGAYGGEVSDVLVEASVLTKEGQLKTISADQLELGYRTSNIEANGYLVLEATFRLTEGNPAEIKAKMDELTFLRESKQPLEYPSCGSVFKRPPGHFAGKLIQDSHLQGKRIGGAEVSTKHAGFIVNVDGATATDYLELIAHVQNEVRNKFSVELEREVRVIGEDRDIISS